MCNQVASSEIEGICGCIRFLLLHLWIHQNDNLTFLRFPQYIIPFYLKLDDTLLMWLAMLICCYICQTVLSAFSWFSLTAHYGCSTPICSSPYESNHIIVNNSNEPNHNMIIDWNCCLLLLIFRPELTVCHWHPLLWMCSSRFSCNLALSKCFIYRLGSSGYFSVVQGGDLSNSEVFVFLKKIEMVLHIFRWTANLVLLFNAIYSFTMK